MISIKCSLINIMVCFTLILMNCKKEDTIVFENNKGVIMEIKKIKSGVNNIQVEVVVNNQSNQTIRISEYSMYCAVKRIKLIDAKGQQWTVKSGSKIIDPPELKYDYQELIIANASRELKVESSDEEVLVRDSDGKSWNKCDKDNPEKCHYELKGDLDVSDPKITRVTNIPFTSIGNVTIVLK